MDSNEYFSRMGEFLVSSSALNFLSCRVILELKSVMDKNISAKGKNERSPSSTMPSGSGGNISGSGSGDSGVGAGGSGGSGGSGGGFGVSGFISAGGNMGPGSTSSPSSNEEYDLPLPQEAPTFKPVDIVITKQETLNTNTKGAKKSCIVCTASIPKQAKFCNKCGNSQ